MQFRDFYTERRSTQQIVTSGVKSLQITNLYIYLDYLDKPSIYAARRRPGYVHVVHATIPNRSCPTYSRMVK
jgi:hypothetical protein